MAAAAHVARQQRPPQAGTQGVGSARCDGAVMVFDPLGTLTSPGAEPRRRRHPGMPALRGVPLDTSRPTPGELPHVRAARPQDADTLLPVTGHGEAATRFVLTVPADLPMVPLRVYASLMSAPTPEARVDLAIRELERQGAFRRANILVAVATGGGHVNPVTLETVERLADGNVASVAIQYGTRPSILSIDKVDDARRVTRMLLERIRDRIRADHPRGGGPRVLLYGESLGGWASQSALESGAEPELNVLDSLGVARAAWIGLPGFSRFHAEHLGPGGMRAMHGIAQLGALSAGDRARARAWELSHIDDPVHRSDLALIFKRPDWLPADGRNPRGVGPHERWRPLLTFLDTLKRALRSANTERPGEFTDHGHDYRKELPTLLRAAYGFEDVTDAELARITEQVRQSEVWIMAQDWT